MILTGEPKDVRLRGEDGKGQTERRKEEQEAFHGQEDGGWD